LVAILFEGNRYALDEIELAPGFPQTATEAVGEGEGEPERRNRVYGPGEPGWMTRHGTDVRQELIDNETERFFRTVDEAVLEQYSRTSGLPLLLAALPEHHHLFRSVSRNPQLMSAAIDTHPSARSADELRERAWQIVLPIYWIASAGSSTSSERRGRKISVPPMWPRSPGPPLPAVSAPC
jgi:hypothetical protein